MTHRLFCYGTLRDAAVQREIFGRTLEGRPDALGGYRLKMTRVLDQAFVAASGAEFHRTLDRTGRASDQVEGMALAVSERELALADSYEPAGYQRVLVELASGTSAWVYLSTGE
jgi:hypothetical protein